MSQSRKLALEAIYKINEENAYSNLVLNETLSTSNLSSQDKGLTTELVYGSVRYRNRIDYIIDQFADRLVTDMTPWVRNALRLGVYQLDGLDKIPPHAACNETVEAAKQHCNKGAVGYINAILRNILRCKADTAWPELERDPIQHIRYRYSFPQWMVENWYKDFGLEKTLDLVKELNTVAKMTLRTNTLKITTEELLAELAQTDIKASQYQFGPKFKEAVAISDYGSVEELEYYQQGLCQVQGLSSMLVSHIVGPKADDFIIDLCAGLGGKTTHLAQLMENQGQIMATDINQSKLETLEQNCQRLGVENVITKAGDGTELEVESKPDKILIDAPCSGFGVIDKKPEIKWHRKPQDIQSLVKLQQSLLANAAELLKDGGELVYSTCTFNRAENEAIIEDFLAKNDEFSLVNLAEQAEKLELEEFISDKYIKIVSDSDFDGFFIAKLIKAENNAGESNAS